jgi:hypothetical protein
MKRRIAKAASEMHSDVRLVVIGMGTSSAGIH